MDGEFRKTVREFVRTFGKDESGHHIGILAQEKNAAPRAHRQMVHSIKIGDPFPKSRKVVE